VRGGALGHLLVNNTCTKVEPTKLWKYLADVVRGLRYLHRKGYYHKDIRPDNILVDEKDRAILCDFGVSEHSPNGLSNTHSGTLCFMPPEVLTLATGEAYDLAAADVWSLGCAFYTLLTGHAPYPESTFMSTRSHILDMPVVYPANCSREWEYVLSRILDKDPLKRATLMELRHYISEISVDRLTSSSDSSFTSPWSSPMSPTL